jgi:hypothetical protein
LEGIVTVVALVEPGIPFTDKVSPIVYPEPEFAISRELEITLPPELTSKLIVALEPVPPQRGRS